MKHLLLNLILIISITTISRGQILTYSSADSGPGTLRQAILDANAAGVPEDIWIDGGVGVYQLLSPLPEIQVDLTFNFVSVTTQIDGNGMAGPVFPYANNVNVSISNTNLSASSIINFSSTIFTVTNTNDAGQGSLRRAIDYAAQTSIKDYIHFNIPGTAPHTITLSQDIYMYDHYPLEIRGETQPANEYVGNLPKITLNQYEFEVDNSNDCSISGVMFDRCYFNMYYSNNWKFGGNTASKNVTFINSAGIYCTKCNDMVVENTYFGIDTDDGLYTAYDPSKYGIRVSADSNVLVQNCVFADGATPAFHVDSNLTFIANKVGTNIAGTQKAGVTTNFGGTSLPYNNVTYSTIGTGNTGEGNIFAGPVYFNGGNSNFLGNYLGTDITGESYLGYAILNIYGDSLQIGGPGANEGNLLLDGVDCFLDDGLYAGTKFFGNKFGLSKSGNTLDTLRYGIKAIDHFRGHVPVEIGRIDPGYGNEFQNCDTAIYLSSVGSGSIALSGVTIRGNSMRNNGKGIELSYGNKEANNGVPPPVILNISGNTAIGTTTPNSTVDLYYKAVDDSVFEGFTYLGNTLSDGAGNWSFTHSGSINTNCSLTATTTDISGSTSEFATPYNNSPSILLNDTLVCGNDSIQLNISGGTAFTWSTSYGLSDSTIANPNAAPSVDTIYYVEITDILGCVFTDSIYVTSEILPIVSVPSEENICNEDTIMLNASATPPGVTYAWGPNTAINDTTISNPEVFPSSDTEYIITVTTPFGCSASDTISVFVSICSSLNENSNANFAKVKPNPVDNWLTITLKNQVNCSFQLLDNTGRVLLFDNLYNTSNTINTSSLEPGYYLLKINEGKRVQAIKVIKY